MRQRSTILRWGWLTGIASVLGLVACVSGEPEAGTGSATFSKTAPFANNDYAPQSAQPDALGGAAGAGATTAAPPTSSAPIAPTPAASPPAVPMAGPGGSGGAMALGGSGGSSAGAGGTGGIGGSVGGGGSGATGDAGMIAPPPVSSGPGMLSVSITSASVGGRYAPRNVGAIWIESASGTFVKTIERWVAIRTSDLRTWNQRSGGWGFSFFGASSSPDAVDCVTAATLTSHRAHNPTWAMKDVDGMVVPDGDYKVVLEVGDGSNATAEATFTKGPMPQTVTVPAGKGFSSFTVTYTP